MKALPTEDKFDLVFIDADKKNNSNYVIEAKRLTRPGGVIVSICCFTEPAELTRVIYSDCRQRGSAWQGVRPKLHG